MFKLKQTIISGMMVAIVALISPNNVYADDNVEWRLVSTHGSNLPIIGVNAKRLAVRIDEVTGGSVAIEFFEPGALVPANAVFDAVSEGSVDAGFHHGAFLAGRIPAAQFIGGSVPFSFEFLEHWAWYDLGGGRQIHEELYAPFNVHPMLCVGTSREAAGWYRKPINSVADFDGLRFRIAGLGGAVLGKLGVSTQVTPVSEIYPALERGVLDATDVGTPAYDIVSGYHEIAKHYYFPGWHQPTSFFELLVNKEKWESLNDVQRTQVEAACRDMISTSIADSENAQEAAITELKTKGVKFERFSDEILTALHNAWEEVVAEQVAANEGVKKVHESMTVYHKKNSVWTSTNSMKSDW